MTNVRVCKVILVGYASYCLEDGPPCCRFDRFLQAHYSAALKDLIFRQHFPMNNAQKNSPSMFMLGDDALLESFLLSESCEDEYLFSFLFYYLLYFLPTPETDHTIWYYTYF